MAITTHAALDHQGGNESIKARSPHTLLACGEPDRKLVEDPRKLFDERYTYLQNEHGVGFDPDPGPDTGRLHRMDLTFSGGERIRLADDWALDVLHDMPGHWHGHLALYDGKNKTAFVGDAIHGRGCPRAEGGLAIPVTYYYVDIYLSALCCIESIEFETLYSEHSPIMTGKEIRDCIVRVQHVNSAEINVGG